MNKFAAAIAVIVLAVGTTIAASSENSSRSEDERHVLEQLKEGEPADLKQAELSSEFIIDLLTNRHGKFDIRQHLVTINNAVIQGDIQLLNDEIANDIALTNCTFKSGVDFTGTHFARNLDLSGSIFEGKVDLENVAIDFSFTIEGSHFNYKPEKTDDVAVFFQNMRIGRDVTMRGAQIAWPIDFTQSNIAGRLWADDANFGSTAEFDAIVIRGETTFRRTVFNGPALFGNTHFSNLFLTNANFTNSTRVDFRMLQVDNIFLDDVTYPKQAAAVLLQGMTFKSMSPASWERLQNLRNHSGYDTEFYTSLETLFRSHGRTREADQIYIEMQRHDRTENCRSLLHDCGGSTGRLRWFGNLLEDCLTGYGRSLENLLLWSVGFILVGTLVFRRTAMKPLGNEEVDLEFGTSLRFWRTRRWLSGLIGGFWYSLDLFLPIIELGEREKWIPKDNRTYARVYRRMHAIIGHIFVPVGLAAWTGIIK